MNLGVKFCGVMNETDIQKAASAGARAVGVIIRPDSTYHERSAGSHSVNIDTGIELARLTPYSMAFVAVTHTEDYDEIAEIADRIGPDRLQLGESEDPELAARLRERYPNRPYPVIAQVIRVGDDTKPEVINDYPGISFFHLDSPGDKPGGNGEVHDWEKSRAITSRARKKGKFVILAGGLTPDNVAEAAAIGQPDGVDTETGARTDGAFDEDKMRLFVENAIGEVPHETV